MGCVEISTSAKFWDVFYASVFLAGEERERALRQQGVMPVSSMSSSVRRTAVPR